MLKRFNTNVGHGLYPGFSGGNIVSKLGATTTITN